jgi:hypothetical protein
LSITAPAKSPCENSAKSKDCGPQAQRVDAVGAVADHRPIVGHAEQIGRAIAREIDLIAAHLEGGIERYHIDATRSWNLPRITEAQPVVGLLELRTASDELLEDAVFVAQAVADCGVLQRGQ